MTEPTERTFTLTADQILSMYVSAQISGIATFTAATGATDHALGEKVARHFIGQHVAPQIYGDPAVRESLLDAVQSVADGEATRLKEWL